MKRKEKRLYVAKEKKIKQRKGEGETNVENQKKSYWNLKYIKKIYKIKTYKIA